MARFQIVVPTFQADGWLNECLNSIFGQEGGHEVRLHLQDGGSTDSTLEVAERWRSLSEAPASPFSGRVTMSIESGPDGGLYDAVMRGVATLDPEPGDVMTWLNADDLLAPGALNAVASLMRDVPEVEFCGGRGAVVDARGRVVRISATAAAPRPLIAAGLYDGRRMPFVMQEGAFWRQELWARVGGLNSTFRLAGDWDLWRRMAQHADYVAMDVVTGFHRRRPGQLSANLDAYYAEVDRALSGEARLAYDDCDSEYRAAGRASPGWAIRRFEGPVAQIDPDTSTWFLTNRYCERVGSAMVRFPAYAELSRRGRVVDGARAPEGPYPEWDLPAGVCWLTERVARLVVRTQGPGRSEVRLTCRPGIADLSVTVRCAGEVVHASRMSPCDAVRDEVLTFEVWGDGADIVLTVETSSPHGDPDNRLLLVDLTSVCLPPPESPCAAAPDAPRVLVVDEGRPHGLAATLASLSLQTPSPSVTVALAAENGASLAVVDAWRPMVDRLTVDADVNRVARTLAGIAFDIVLSSGLRVAPYRLGRLIEQDGAVLEVDRDARRWIRPACSQSSPSYARPRQSALPATDIPLTLAAPGDDGGPETKPVSLGVAREGAAVSSALRDVLSRLELGALPGALEAQQSEEARELTLFPARGTADEFPAVDRLTPLAEAALDFLDVRRHPRTIARDLFDLDVDGEVWAVAEVDLARVLPCSEAAGVTVLGIGDGALLPDVGDPWVPMVPAADRGLLAWALSAADRLAVTTATTARLRTMARALGLEEIEIDSDLPPSPAVLDPFVTALCDAVGLIHETQSRQSPALRFLCGGKSADTARVVAGRGVAAAHSGLLVSGNGEVFIFGADEAGVQLRLGSSELNARQVELIIDGVSSGYEILGEEAVLVRASKNRPVRVQINLPPGSEPLQVNLWPDSMSASEGDGSTVNWTGGDGFGREEAPAPELGLNQTFRWIEGRAANLSVTNRTAGWKRLTLRLRSLVPDQRIMVDVGNRIVEEAAIPGGTLADLVNVTLDVCVEEGDIELRLRFSSAVQARDRQLAAILDGVVAAPIPEPDQTALTEGWAAISGFDFEEPAAPQFGLEQPFRWYLPGARIAIAAPDVGRYRVDVVYRTAVPAQRLTAGAGGEVLGWHEAVSGSLNADECLSFEVDLAGSPVEVELRADAYLEVDRSLGFIIQSVRIEPVAEVDAH